MKADPVFLFLKIFICLFSIVGMLYVYIDQQNDLIEWRIKVRASAKELRELQEDNIALRYEVDRFESPVHLMELARQPAFSYLKYPHNKDILMLKKESSHRKQNDEHP